MKRLLLPFVWAAALGAQTVTQPNPAVPPNLKPQATGGDLTRCVITPWGTTNVNFHIDCKIGSRVTHTVTAVFNNTMFMAGQDLVIWLQWDAANKKLVHYWATANTRDATGGVTACTLIAQADIRWP